LAASVLRHLEVAAERLDRWVDAISVAILAAMTVIACLEVFVRYVLRQSLPWAEELPKYLMIWLTFLGASLVTRRDAHVGFTTLIESLPPRARRWIVLVGRLLVLLFLYYVVHWGIVLALTMGFVSVTSALQIPFFYVFLAVPIGGGLMILQLAALTLRDFASAGREG